ncbi:TetR/AcrR family transcriptional regulator [Cellulomonas endophytica]|uniref:TetR/AcrR family transcriptional regulator n=1 Tax=Cellulomonas endophytica TaxID=2494735 RepID=UPI001F0C7C33|nr:TetR/AcrR family transcriptional regulator [Cellulomonas endophytica]
MHGDRQVTDARDAAPTSGPVPRVRGQRLARDARRTQVLEVAEELFSTQGFHHVSMDDIAERACVGKPVLYRHFPSKLDLYLAVVDGRGDVLLHEVEAALQPLGDGPVLAGDGRRVVDAVVRAFFAFVAGSGASSNLLFESDVTHDPAVRARVESATGQVEQRVATVLGSAAGLAPAPAGLASVALIALVRAAATHHWRHPDRLPADEAVALVSTLCWDGVVTVARGDRPDRPDRTDPTDPTDPADR